MATLKELLGDSYKDTLTAAEIDKLLETKKLADLTSGNYVDKQKYEDLKKDLEAKSTSASEQLKQLDELRKTAGASEQLKTEIDNLKKTLTDKESEFTQKYNARERQYLIDDVLKSSKPKNLGALKGALNGKFDFDKAEIKDGKIAGFDDILNDLKKSDEYLFEQTAPTIPAAGREPHTPLSNDPFVDGFNKG